MRRTISLVLTLALAIVLLAGCGDNTTAAKKETSQPQNQSTQSDTSSKQISVIDTMSITSGSVYDDPNWSPYATIPESIKGSTVRFATWIDHTQT